MQGKLAHSLFTLGELALVDEGALSDAAVVAIQTLASSPAAGDGRLITDASTRGHAIVALGKLCLRREDLAKRSVELFVLHLSASDSFAVRSNALVVLGDLCEHYTSLVDRFVPSMADLLRDPNELLRKQSAMVLASLLSENFIKFRGSLLYRFVYALSDPADDVRLLVESVFARIIHRQHPALLSQSFVDIICAINGWAGHDQFQGAVGNECFSLQASPARRTAIYRFLLSLMSREHKFSVCAQLVTVLLASFIEEEERLLLPKDETEPGGQALDDVLALLGCKEMKVCFSGQASAEEAIDAELAASQAVSAAGVAVAQGALSAMLRKVVCESIVPVLVQLRRLMEEQRSPFLGRLGHCLCEILREFKDDLRELCGGDARLAQEVAFDLSQKDGPKARSQRCPLSCTARATETADLGVLQGASQGILPIDVEVSRPDRADALHSQPMEVDSGLSDLQAATKLHSKQPEAQVFRAPRDKVYSAKAPRLGATAGVSAVPDVASGTSGPAEVPEVPPSPLPLREAETPKSVGLVGAMMELRSERKPAKGASLESDGWSCSREAMLSPIASTPMGSGRAMGLVRFAEMQSSAKRGA